MRLNQSGQIAVEYVLLMVVFLGIFLGTKNLLMQNNFVGNFVQKPWSIVAGMIETGTWGEAKKTRKDHPGFFRRHTSFKGDDE